MFVRVTLTTLTVAAIVLFVTICAMFLARNARAEVCNGRGQCVQWTADKVATEQRLRCVYGAWRTSTDAKGRTIITRDKVCMQPVEFTR